MGGKKATTTSKVTIPPEVLARYNAVNKQAVAAAATPYQAFGKTAADYVAQMNAQQGAGIADINATAGSYQPYMTQATSATQAGMGPAYESIENYMSPYIKNVADTTGAYMRQQQEQAQSGALGTAAMSGAFGGDRAGIAAANLQQQNQMGYGKTMADIMNQGYTQALGASQADLARQLQGGAQMAGLGAQSQQLGLQGAQAKIAAGTMQQQTEQAGKDAMINQFMQEKGYPFQVAQFLANIAMGTGAASGSTTTTQTPRNWLGFASGGAVEGYASGGVAGPRTYTQSGVGGEGYVPAGDLPVGQLMIADPPEQSQGKGTEEIIKMITMAMGAARGGAIDQRHGYATDGGVFLPDIVGQNETRGEMLARLMRPAYHFATSTLPKSAVALGTRALSVVPEGLSYGLAGAQMPQASDLMHSTALGMNDFANRTSDEGLKYRGANQPEPLTGQAALNLAKTTPEQDAAREAFMRQNMDLEPSRTAADGYTPSDYGAAMLRGPTAAGWTLGNQPRVTTMTPNGVAGRPDVPVGSMPVAPQEVYGRPNVPVGSMPAAPITMSNIPAGSMPAPSLNSLVAGRPNIPVGDLSQAFVGREAWDVPGAESPYSANSMLHPGQTLGSTPSETATDTLTTSMRPRRRPVDLGTQISTSGVDQAVPVVTPAVPAVDTNGVAGPEQTGIYTGVAGAGAGWVDLTRPDGSVEHRTGARNWRNNNPGNIEYGKLAQQYGAIGTDGRFAIFPDEQSGRNAMKGLLFDSGVYQGMTIASALNKYSPPSENDTEGKIRAVVAEIGLDPNTPLDQMTPQQRDAFTLAIQHTEGPMKGDVGASSPYTTSQVGGLGSADMTQQRDGLFNNNKSYEDRNFIGKFFHDPTTGKLNPNAVMALLSGIGNAAQAQTISPLGGILAGIGAGSDTYKNLLKQQADIGLTQAQAYRENVGADVGRFFTWGNIPMVSLGNGKAVKISEYLASPEAYSTGNPQQDAAILRQAQTRASTEETAPTNTRWTNASRDAIAAAKQYAASDVGAANFVANNEAVQNLTLQANEAMNSSVAAKPNVNELAYTVGSSIADGTMGSAQGRNSVLQNVLAPLNSILRSAGINMDTLDDTQTQAQLLDKISTLNADSLTPEQQRSKAVFEQFANVSPNLEMTPEAAAAITSSLMLSNQDNIDAANYYSRFQQEAGMGFAPQQMSSGYTNEYGQLHQIEKNNLTNLFTAAEDKTVLGNSGMTRGQYVKNFLDQANRGGLTQDQAQAILNYILGPENTSQALARYFIKGM